MLSAQDMPSANSISMVVTAAVVSLESAVLTMLVIRKAWREFPIFTAYVGFHVTKAAYLLVLRALGKPYYPLLFYSYWICAALIDLFALAFTYELYGQVFRRYPGMERLGRLLLNCIAACVVLVAIVAAARLPVNAEFTRRVQAFNAVTTAFDIVRLGLVLFLFLFAAYFRLRWSSKTFGIAAGVALYISCELAFQGIEIRFGQSASLTYGIATGIAYLTALFIWLRYFRISAPIADQSFEPPLHDLGLWNDAMAGMLK